MFFSSGLFGGSVGCLFGDLFGDLFDDLLGDAGALGGMIDLIAALYSLYPRCDINYLKSLKKQY
jgi:hypothetical protein